MKKRWLTAVAFIGFVFVAGQAAARLLEFNAGDVLRAIDLNDIVKALTGATDDVPPIQVNCDAGDTITGVLPQALPGSTIDVTGTCHETIIITTDGLTLDGQGTAIIDGGGGDQPGISIEGVQGITIKNLTVQNGFRGIHARNGAALVVDNVTAQENVREGIRLARNSTATFRGTIICNSNGDDGIIILETSSGVFDSATVQLNNNQGTVTGTNGINVTIGSSAVFNGGTLEANGNTNHGIAVRRTASVFLANMETITTNGNGTHGIFVHGGSDLALFGSPQLSATNNGGTGIIVSESSNISISASGEPTITLDANGGSGLFVGGSSRYRSSGTLTIRNSGGNGIFVTGQSDLNINSATSITNNGSSGILVQNSHVAASQNLTVTENDSSGIVVLDNGVLSMSGNAIISGNGTWGVSVFRSSTVFMSPTVQILNHVAAAGLRVAQNSQVDASGIEIRNNLRGISVDDSSVTITDATITNSTNNDLVATLGSRLTLNGSNTIGTIFCEQSVLTRPDTVCP